jgi:L-ascorbate metabolism protein UlaG (beta-lactamase superfamily)
MIHVVFHGHSAVEVRSPEAPTLLFDPYRPDGLGGRFRLTPIEAEPDVLAITHHHEDHSYRPAHWAHVPAVDTSGTCCGLEFEVIPAYHDTALGTTMGLTSLIAVQYAGTRIVHLGDLGAPLTARQRAFIASPDILIVPIGGTYTLGPDEAARLTREIAPGWALPVHGAHPGIALPLRPVSEFLEAWEGAVESFHESEATWTGRPHETCVIALTPRAT